MGLFDTGYGETRRGIGWYPRQAPQAAPMSLWDLTEAAAMTPVPGVADVASGALAARDFSEGRPVSGLLNAAGALPFVPALGNIFIGVKGANRAQKQALVTAQKMAKEGANRDEIWNATLWGKFPDGKWRTEISDEGMKWKTNFPEYKRGQLDSFIEHPALFEQLPWTRYLDVEVTREPRTGGAYTDRLNKIDVSAPDRMKAQRVLAHEISHPVQQRHGLARGGSPEALGKEVTKARADVEEYERLLEKSGRQAQAEAEVWMSRYPEKVKEAADYLRKQGLIDEGKPITRDAIAFAITEQDRVHQGWLNEWRKAGQAARQSPTDAYRRLAGEAEARLAANRMNLTMPERQAMPPWSEGPYGWDVPEADQIVRMEGGTAMSIADVPMADLDAQIDAMRAANRAKGLPPETGTGDLRNERARRKAVELLGLPEGNTAADRASAMGFDTAAYHGTQTPDVMEFDISRWGNASNDFHDGPSIFAHPNPAIANFYAYGDSPGIIPLRMKSGTAKIPFDTQDVIEQTPANIRSRFAAFDPSRRDEADLLAGLLPYAIPAGLLGLLTLPREEYQ